MRKIIQLSQNIIARIAAGEVVERPVFAVKELVENALDANASSIVVQIEQSGLRKIVVSDNGDGMSYEDLHESVKAHTTSKLFDESLMGITTLGFRGEALASIAAVSDMVIQSRIANTHIGTVVSLKAGVLEFTSPIGMPPGTIVTVKNLFHTVPARKRFLKSEQTEFRHIVDLVTQYALAFPTVRFLLQHNKRIVLDLPAAKTHEERVATLLGPQIHRYLLPLNDEGTYIAVQGYIAHPQLSTRSSGKYYVFINNRAVRDTVVTSAVKEAYGRLLESNRFPIFVLYLQVPYEVVDVNVHPRKEQVSFVNSEMIFNAVKDVVRNTLTTHNLVFQNPRFSTYSGRSGTTKSVAANILREQTIPWNVKDDTKLLHVDNIQQLHKTYLFVQTQRGFLLIDQHAAHERILFEQYLDTYSKSKHIQNLYIFPQPLPLHLTFEESEALSEHLSTFQKMGFDISHTENTIYSIAAVPMLFQDRDVVLLIREFLEDIMVDDRIKEVDAYSQTMIAFLACRMAIKAGDMLTYDEAERLVHKLEETDNNATCPHGRPTKIEVPLTELHKWFNRN